MSKSTATGYRSTGNRSTGGYRSHMSTGNKSTGDYAMADRATGFFATETPKPSFFDHEVDMTWEEAQALVPYIVLPLTEWIPTGDMTAAEKADHPSHTTTGGYLRKNTYHEAWAKWWAAASDSDKQRFLDLPHFDAAKFERITGINVEQAVEYITIGDRTYRKDEVEAALAYVRSEGL